MNFNAKPVPNQNLTNIHRVRMLIKRNKHVFTLYREEEILMNINTYSHSQSKGVYDRH